MVTIEDLLEKAPLQHVASRDSVAFELYGTVQYVADREKLLRILAVDHCPEAGDSEAVGSKPR